jgi:competence protein ComEA
MKIILLTFSLFIVAANAATQDNAAKALLERTCTKCHSMDSVQGLHNSKEQWSAVVDDMVSRGAEASDTEIEQIVDYLTKTQGVVKKVNVNKAAAAEIAGVLEIPAGSASAIVAYREKNGNFKSIDDLKKVPGLDAKAIDSKKDRLDFADAK